MTSPLRVHVLYEHTVHPHSSGFIRLLRPLTYPSLASTLDVSIGRTYRGIDADVVIVDRLWQPAKLTLKVAREMVNEIRVAGARFVYALDDDFFAIPEEHPNRPTSEQLQAVDYFLRTADALWVTTPYLKDRFASYNRHIEILPNCLDDRLLVRRSLHGPPPLFGRQKRVIGYMGTLTHSDDFAMILPSLEAVCARHPEVEIQIIGGIDPKTDAYARLSALPVRFLVPDSGEGVYPNFMLWYTSRISWDIALAPLVDTDFNQAKSDIKFLDYAAIGTPGIFSDVEAYRGHVVHGENGWLCSASPDAWENAIETLLQQPEMRISLASAAQKYVFTRRTLLHCAMDWLDALRHLE